MRNTASTIVDMIEGTNVVVSHGNGPQVGMINNAFARGGQRRQDPGHALPRGRRHVPGPYKRRRGVRFLVGEGTLGPPFTCSDGRPLLQGGP